MSDILTAICRDKEQWIETCKSRISPKEMQVLAQNKKDTCLGFAQALKASLQKEKIGLIAEIKKASPSRGLIRADFDPALLARSYRQGGATCLSVLTDEKYFQGKDEYIFLAKQAANLPVLRKDFILDPYQIYEARYLGADCILLILAALSDAKARELEDVALELGMDVLVETHDAEEMARAVKMKSPLIGVNNRNLKTLEIDMGLSEKLLPQVPADKIAVAESGFYAHADLARLKERGCGVFLVGESLMRQADIVAATKSLLGLAVA